MDELDEKALKEIEEVEAKENDEEWKQERQQVVARQDRVLTQEERDDNLKQLLAKAEKYTEFLDRKLMEVNAVGHGEDVSLEEEVAIGDKRSSTAAANGNRKRVKADKTTIHTSKDFRIEQPKLMTGGTLRDYQVSGYKWMVGLYENGLHGILADEMGLGKTVQTIALLAHLREHQVYGPFLLVVPLSTITNWIREIRKWVPTMPVLLYHGSKQERAEMRRKHLHGSRSNRDMKQFPVTVTTYEIVIRDRKDIQKCGWKYIIVDEGHRLKNMNCQLIRELNNLAGGSVLVGGANKLLLTGTPLQNNLTELWSLLNFLMPEIFDDLDFFISVFDFEGVGNKAAEAEIVSNHSENSIVSKLHKILAPFMMRRLKSEVEKNMPNKREVVMYIPMTKPQKEMYDSIVNGELAKILESVTGSKKTLNNVLMQLRKCSLHPYLHYEPQVGDGEHHTTEDLIEASGKLKVLDHMLRKLKKNGNKVLIFSQFTTMLDIIQDYLEELRPDMGYCRIDGTTKLDSRKEQMDAFNTDPNYFVFLLSTRAGGVGINLTAADTVVIFDSDWNPHQDNQAQDRCHRIGQTNDVAVYRMITSRSVELKILERANSKRKLERVVCAKQATIKHRKNKAMGTEDLLELLTNDFTGHLEDHGDLTTDTLDILMDRTKLFEYDETSKNVLSAKGVGYEIVSHKSAAIVGGV